jgi:hypothetical protein
MTRISQSVAKRVLLKAYLAADHITPGTGLTIPVVISINGAAFANPNAGATDATEIEDGWYFVDLDTTDTGTLGPLIVRGTEGTIDPTEIAFSVEVPILANLAQWLGTTPLALDSQRVQVLVGAVTDGVLTAAKFAAGAFDAVWTVAARTLTSFGTLVADTAAAAAVDVWAAGTRTLTSLAGNAADIRAAVGLAAADLDTQLGTIVTNQGTILAGLTTINNNVLLLATPADVNAQVLDVLRTDTFGAPTGVPGVTVSMGEKLDRLYQALHNGLTVTSADKTFLDEAAAPLWKKPISDNGTIFTEGAAAAAP